MQGTVVPSAFRRSLKVVTINICIFSVPNNEHICGILTGVDA